MYLVTLTIGHSGDVGRDRAELWEGWRAWKKWLDGHVGEAYPYAAVWEVTPGTDAKGHVHCHVAMVLPFFDWEASRAAWAEACPRSKNVDYQRSTAQRASKYLAKYMTKGVQVATMPGALAGELLSAWYGKRKVSASTHFWRPLEERGPSCCRRCAALWRIVERPSALSRAAPSAVWAGFRELYGRAVSSGLPPPPDYERDYHGLVPGEQRELAYVEDGREFRFVLTPARRMHGEE